MWDFEFRETHIVKKAGGRNCMLYGWVGKILKVNLSTKDISEIDTAKYIPHFIGGKGISLKIAWDILKAGIGPFDPDNIIIFMTGPLTGTLAPTSGRGIISSISPRVYPNPWFTRSGIGGFWAPELKYAGYDGLLVLGKADLPVYIWICNNNVIIKDAQDFWGKGAIDTQRIIKDIHGEEVQVLCIGPAGENLIRSATIQHNLSNASGQAGFGSVMGSKNLKAVVIRGTGGVRIAEPIKFLEACKYVENQVRNGMNIVSMIGPKKALHNFVNCSQACPCFCWYCKASKNIPAKIGVGSLTTVIHCQNYNYVGTWNCTEYDRPEVSDIKTKALPGFGGDIDYNCLMKELGLNEWDYWSFYTWFDAFIQNGINSVKGLKLDINSPKFWFDFFRMVANREGVGDIFAEGVVRASNRLGDLEIPEKLWNKLRKIAYFLHPAYGFPEHRLGRSYESQPSPIWIFTMLHWAFDTRDPMSSHHQTSFVQSIFPPDKVLKDDIPGENNPYANVPFKKIKGVYCKIFGNGEIIEPGFEPMVEKVKSAIWFQDRSSIKDSLLLCDWVFPRTFSSFSTQEELDRTEDLTGDIDIESKLFYPVTGIQFSSRDLEKCGERIKNLERALHIRNYNRNRKIDETIEWLCELPEKVDGTKLNKEIFKKLINTYYKIRGWNKTNGYPTRKKLKELDLGEIADVLYIKKHKK